MTAQPTAVAVSEADAAAALPYPGEDPAALDTVAARITGAIVALAGAAETVDAVRSALPAAWVGAAARTGAAEVDRVRSALDDGAERLYQARSALFRCADRLREVRVSVDRLRIDWRRAEGSVRALEQALTTVVEPTQRPVLADQHRAGVVRRGLAVSGGAAAVARADAATLDCRSALAATISGDEVYVPGRGVITADLGAALGTASMVSDDHFRAVLARLDDDAARWAALGSSAQAFALATAGPLPAANGNPAMLAAWWSSRNWAEQQAVVHDVPGAVGATDGLPTSIRDQANRLVLDLRDRQIQQALDAGDPTLAGIAPAATTPTGAAAPGDRALATAMALGLLRQEQTRIADLRARLAAPVGQPLLLMAVDTAGRGRAVVAVGDPDTAQHVATYVPGTGSDLGGLQSELDRVRAWTEGVGATGGGSTAGVVWLGYDSPPGLSAAAYDAYADTGAPALIAYQQGLRAAHQGAPARNVVIGHSYGALVVAAASTGGHVLDADGILLVGPVGLEVDTVTDLHLEGVPPEDMGDRVVSMLHRNDLISLTGVVHGGVPYSSSFGARVVVTDAVGGLDGWDLLGGGGAVLWDLVSDGLDAHGAYQDPGSVEQRVTSAFIAGRLRFPPR